MPICLSPDSSGHALLQPAPGSDWQTPVKFRERDVHCVDIGLLNNMPDGALHATERQFFKLLGAAADGILVRLWLFALPEVPRSELSQCHISRFYSAVEDLWGRHLDGLIVTGTEPRAANLKDEPYWVSMARVFDWAERNTHSTVYSCLAAHAAVLHMDGVARHHLHDKCFGVFDCTPARNHHLTGGVSASLVMPHSRWNGLAEEDLTSSGYEILTRSKHAGVDTFVKRNKSLMVFFQGHPEYESNTLMLEYRRDIGRYLRRERETYPPVPAGYFDQTTLDAMMVAQERGMRERSEEVLQEFPRVLAERNLVATWRPASVRIYGNWLTYLSAQKARRLQREVSRKALATSRGPGLLRASAAAPLKSRAWK